MLKFIILLLISFGLDAAVSNQEYHIRFGYLDLDGKNQYYVSKDTAIIPLRIKETGFRWGYTIESKVPIFSTYNMMYADQPFEIATNYKKQVDRKVLKSKTHQVSNGLYAEEIWNDLGDPLGKQKIEIYINGKLYRIFHFEIVEDQ